MVRNADLLRVKTELDMLSWPDGEIFDDAVDNLLWFIDSVVWIKQTPAYSSVTLELRRRGLRENMRAAIRRARQQHKWSALKGVLS